MYTHWHTFPRNREENFHFEIPIFPLSRVHKTGGGRTIFRMRDSFKFPLFYADLGETGSRVSSRRKWRHVIHDIWRPGCEKSQVFIKVWPILAFEYRGDRLFPRLPFMSLDIYTRFPHINGFSWSRFVYEWGKNWVVETEFKLAL